MNKLSTLGIALTFTVGLCHAERYTGKLMDADCYRDQKVASHEAGHKTYHAIVKTCAATPATSRFAVRITDNPYWENVGQTIKLDDEGNSLASSEMKSGGLKTDDDGDVHVKVHGKLLGETFKTSSLNGRGGERTVAGIR